MTAFLTIFRRFPTLSKDFRRFSKIVPKARRMLPNIFQNFPRISEDCQRLSRKDPIAKTFWSYTNKFKYNLRDKLDISEIINTFASEAMENTPLKCLNEVPSFVWILPVVYFQVKHSCLNNKMKYANMPKIKEKNNYSVCGAWTWCLDEHLESISYNNILWSQKSPEFK